MCRMANPSLQILLQTAKECHNLLDAADIPHAVIGGLAVCLHGYKRDTRDVDLLVRQKDWDRIWKELSSKGFVKQNKTELLSPKGVKVSLRIGGEKPQESEASLPDPAESKFHTKFADLPEVPVFGDLLELMKHKLECGILGQRKGGKWARRSKKHFKDVVGLLTSNDLLP